jgi:hypothetical protein
MRQLLRTWVAAAGIAATAACARQVEVRTGESPTAAGTSIAFTNDLAQAVNVYVRPNAGSGEIFVRQVAGKTTENITVRGVSPGATVTLRAAPIDGSISYTRENVALGQGYAWRVP